MVIANPIYDVVFKRLMENDKVVKFFIGTLFDQVIETIEVKPQEFTHTDKPTGIALFRLDFIATIRTETGEYKKVLIEIQKAKKEIDLMRFRNYLAEQYKKQDKINDENVALPITTIYILGFTLPEITSACIKVERIYKDLINQTVIEQKSDFIEKLTHDSYVVQVERITNRFQTRLDKLLSIFEQSNFIDDTETIKDYQHTPDIEELKTMTDILHYVGTEPKERKQIETEQEAWRTINAMFTEPYRKELKEKEKELKEKEETIKEQKEALKEKDEALKARDRMIRELLKKIGEKE